METTQARQRAKRGTSCIACRQMKLRCDSGDRFPAACTRCARVGRACSLKATSKGAAKTGRLEQLEKEITSIRRGLSGSGPSSSATRASSPSDSSEDAGSAAPEPVELHTQALEHFEITPTEFMELLDAYYAHYHPQLPFLPGKSQVVSSAARSPILFWAIVAVSCRTSPVLRHMHTQLAWPVRRLVTYSCVQEVASLEQIQALLLLCMWPLPFGSLLDDPAWTFCGLATHAAMQLGMHRPRHVEDFTRDISPDEEYRQVRRNVWLACFILNHNLSLRNGVPATIRPDHTICQAIGEGDSSVPPILRMLVEITFKEYTIATMLGHNETSSDGLHPDPIPLLKAYDQELDVLQRRLERTWTPSIEMVFYGVRVRLYSFALGTPSNRRPGRDYHLSPELSSEAANYLSKLYSAGMHVLDMATQTAATAAAADAEPRADDALHRYWSAMEFAEVSHGVMAVLHVLRRRQHGFETADSQDAIRRTWALLKSASTAPHDHFARMCDIVEFVTSINWPAEAMDSQLPDVPELAVRSRMGANISFDLVRWAKRRWRLAGGERWPDQLADTSLPLLHLPAATAAAVTAPTDLQTISLAEMVPGIAIGEGIDTMENMYWTDWDRSLPQPPGYGH